MNIRIVFFFLFFAVIKFHGQQTPTILRGTITAIGSASVYPIISKSKSYEIQQSIGQGSVIGTKNAGVTRVQQGFLTNVKTFNINNDTTTFIETSLNVIISPNPFIDHIKINFSKKTVHDILIYVYDINGKVLFSKKYKQTDTLTIPMRYYSIGTYLIRIQSGSDKFTEKIIKTVLKW